MEGQTVLAGLILSIMIGQWSRQVEGCVGTFPSLDNSNKECSNTTTTCAVTCTSDRIFYDGNNTKNYSCNNDNVWLPSIPKYGCLEKTSKVYRIQLTVVYFLSTIAQYCIDAHQQALSENQLNISQTVFRLCNSNGIVLVGDIVINKFTSVSSSFDIYTTIEFVITDSSTTYMYTAVNACVSILKDELQNGGLKLHEDQLECYNNKTSNISKPLQNITSEVHICNDSDVMVNSENDTVCVPNLPVVGVKQLQYRVNISEHVVLDSDILFGSPIISVDWWHGNKIITTSGSLKYRGSTPNVPSLTINDVTHGDSGEYTCRVLNRYGTRRSHTIMLVVLYSSDDAMTTQQDNSATTKISTETENVDVSISTTNGSIAETISKRHYEKELEEDNKVYIALGTGCSALLILVIISIITIKRKIFCQAHDKKVYDNILHQDIVHSDSAYDGLRPNIVDVPYENHGVMDVHCNDGTLEPQHVDQNYCTVALDSSKTRVNNQPSQETTQNPISNNHYVNTTF